MKIAYYSHYFRPEIGAPPARIYDLSKQWIRRGHDVQVVTCFPNHPVGRLYDGYEAGWYGRETMDGISVHRHWTYITPNKGFFKKVLGHISYLPSSMALSTPRLERPDVVVGSSPTFFAAMACDWAGAIYRAPHIMEIRDLWPAIFVDLGVLKNPWLIGMLEKLELTLYRRATKVVTVTSAFRDNLVDRGVSPDKVHVIPNGADVDYWRPPAATDRSVESFRRELGLGDKFVVLYIGAHGISHALGRVLDAAATLTDHPEIQFVFVGEGAEKSKLVAAAEERKLQNVRFFDPVDREGVKRFYALSDVCLVPLRDIPLFDTFIPSKMFEIMAMARPMVASVRGEAAEILRNSKGAVITQPEDSPAIAAGVLKLYDNREKRRDLGLKGRSFVTANYSRSILAERYLEVMEEAVSIKGGVK